MCVLLAQSEDRFVVAFAEQEVCCVDNIDQEKHVNMVGKYLHARTVMEHLFVNITVHEVLVNNVMVAQYVSIIDLELFAKNVVEVVFVSMVAKSLCAKFVVGVRFVSMGRLNLFVFNAKVAPFVYTKNVNPDVPYVTLTAILLNCDIEDLRYHLEASLNPG